MEEPAGTKGKILLVEDDEFLLSLIATRLRKSGYEIFSANNGVEALFQVKEHPQLILLDLVLPGFSGFELIAKLRQSPETKDIPFIVLSNSAEQTNQQQAKELGAAGYLVKAQSSPSEIVDAVEAFFASSNASHS
jgi:CheY-like chemotaxis protein